MLAGCAPRESLPQPPQEPHEHLPYRFVYPNQPPVIRFEQFRGFLHQLDRQITLLYLIGPDGEYRRDELACLDRIHRRFYQYAVQVVVIDLHAPPRWPDLVRHLREVDAAMPAAVLAAEDFPALKRFLDRADWPDRQTYLIDPDRLLPRGL